MSETTTTVGDQRVLAEAPSGEIVDLSGLSEKERVVSPDVIRRLCIGEEAGSVDPRGVRIKDARILEPLDLSFCTVGHPLWFQSVAFAVAPVFNQAQMPALWLVRCSLPGLMCNGLVLDHDLTLGACEVAGEVWLLGAQIGSDLNCVGSRLNNAAGDALSADRAEIRGGVFLRDGFQSVGAVRLSGAKIGGDLDCAGASLANEGYALNGDGAEIDGTVFLRDGFAAKGSVRFVGSRIGGELDCAGATFYDEGGYALAADRAEIKGGIFLARGFTAVGAVRLPGARINGDLDCCAATFNNPGGYALFADRAEVAGNVFIREGFDAKGEVRFIGTSIAGDLDCAHGTFTNMTPAGSIALAARHSKIGGSLVLTRTRLAGGFDLFRSMAATLKDDLGGSDDLLGSWSGVEPLVLDGFVYERLDHQAVWSSKHRIPWLKQTTGFQQSAWRHLIEVYRAEGRADEATQAAIAMENDRLERAGLPWYSVAPRRALGILIGHGYRPWLAGIWALGVIGIFAVVVWNWSGMFVPSKPGATGLQALLAPSTGKMTGVTQPVGYAADTFLPIIDLGQASDWKPTGWMRWLDWSVILMGWAMTTIFVAGFTRVVRSE